MTCGSSDRNTTPPGVSCMLIHRHARASGFNELSDYADSAIRAVIAGFTEYTGKRVSIGKYLRRICWHRLSVQQTNSLGGKNGKATSGRIRCQLSSSPCASRLQSRSFFRVNPPPLERRQRNLHHHRNRFEQHARDGLECWRSVQNVHFKKCE